MPCQKTVMPRGKRPLRAAAAVSQAINNVLLGKSNIGPVLAVPAAVAGPSSQLTFAPAHPRGRRLDRPCPTGGIGVKNTQAFRRRNRDIKIKKLLPQAKAVNVKKNSVIVMKIIICRRAYFPGRQKKVY